jgi:uncharacterized membrane protein YhhN
MSNILQELYFLAAFIDLLSETYGNETLQFFSKPLLMLFLMAYYISTVKGRNAFHYLILGALTFSWLGDIALMFVASIAHPGTLMGVHKSPDYFLIGLGCFFVAHIFYIIAFTQVTDRSIKPLLPSRIWIIIPLVIYAGALLSILLPNIYANERSRFLVVPVTAYALAIGTMVALSINRYKRVNDRSFALVFGGAVLFLFSDSIIALNNFVRPLPFAGLLIMSLYIVGQYFIVRGCIEEFIFVGERG